MASFDLIDSHPTSEGVPTQNNSLAAESAECSQGDNHHSDTGAEKRVALPKPDTNNITVLTESLPNEPILPWHHFDSPWLEKEEFSAEEPPEEAPSLPSNHDDHEQLSLELDEIDNSETASEHPKKHDEFLNDSSSH